MITSIGPGHLSRLFSSQFSILKAFYSLFTVHDLNKSAFFKVACIQPIKAIWKVSKSRDWLEPSKKPLLFLLCKQATSKPTNNVLLLHA